MKFFFWLVVAFAAGVFFHQCYAVAHIQVAPSSISHSL
jgi:hypothetical protein